MLSCGSATSKEDESNMRSLLEEEQPTALSIEQIKTYSPVLSSSRPIKVTGKVSVKENLQLNFKGGGEITSIVNENVFIRKGDVLCRIDPFELENQKAELEISLEDLERDLRKLYELQKDDIGSFGDIEKLETKKKILDKKMARVVYNIGKTTLVAPFDGYVSKRNYETGVFVPPLVPVVNFKSAKKNVVAYIAEDIYTQVSLGMDIQLFFEGLEDIVMGKVSSLSYSPSANGLYLMEVAFRNIKTIRDGHSVELNIPVKQEEKLALLPLKFVGNITNGDTVDFYILSAGKIKRMEANFIHLYDDGVALPETFAAYTYIETFNGIDDGIRIID